MKRGDLILKLLYRQKDALQLAKGKKICLDYLTSKLPVADYRSPQFYRLQGVLLTFIEKEAEYSKAKKTAMAIRTEAGFKTSVALHSVRSWALLAAWSAANPSSHEECANAVSYAICAQRYKFKLLVSIGQQAEAYKYAQRERLVILHELADLIRRELILNL